METVIVQAKQHEQKGKTQVKQLKNTMVMVQPSRFLNQKLSGYQSKCLSHQHHIISAMQIPICFGIHTQGSGGTKRVFC